MTFGTTTLPPWALALVAAAVAPWVARSFVDALTRRARARSAARLASVAADATDATDVADVAKLASVTDVKDGRAS